MFLKRGRDVTGVRPSAKPPFFSLETTPDRDGDAAVLRQVIRLSILRRAVRAPFPHQRISRLQQSAARGGVPGRVAFLGARAWTVPIAAFRAARSSWRPWSRSTPPGSCPSSSTSRLVSSRIFSGSTSESRAPMPDRAGCTAPRATFWRPCSLASRRFRKSQKFCSSRRWPWRGSFGGNGGRSSSRASSSSPSSRASLPSMSRSLATGTIRVAIDGRITRHRARRAIRSRSLASDSRWVPSAVGTNHSRESFSIARCSGRTFARISSTSSSAVTPDSCPISSRPCSARSSSSSAGAGANSGSGSCSVARSCKERCSW